MARKNRHRPEALKVNDPPYVISTSPPSSALYFGRFAEDYEAPNDMRVKWGAILARIYTFFAFYHPNLIGAEQERYLAHVTAKLEMMAYGWTLTEDKVRDFIAYVRSHERDPEKSSGPMIRMYGTMSSTYETAIAIQYLIYETQSAFEVVKKHYNAIANMTGHKQFQSFKDLVKSVDHEAFDEDDWERFFNKLRTHFIHSSAPVLMVDSDIDDVIILLEDINDFSDTSKFVRYQDLLNAYKKSILALKRINIRMMDIMISRMPSDKPAQMRDILVSELGL